MNCLVLCDNNNNKNKYFISYTSVFVISFAVGKLI